MRTLAERTRDPVTHQENLRRSREVLGPKGVDGRGQTHCRNGHRFTPENTGPPLRPSAKRSCIACTLARTQPA